MKNIYSKITMLSLFSIATPTALANTQSSLGLSIGSPALINVVFKSNEFGLPIQISGGIWGDEIKGAEIGISFYQNETSIFSSAQFIVGYSENKKSNDYKDKWTYAGVSATYNYGNFYIEPGISFGSGDYSNPQLLLQAGWLWGL